jgi:pimeloyl-ACP methyl ester carboxylesterase
MSYSDASHQFVTAANGVTYAYRDMPQDGIPLIAFMHFRGNLDNWDPALIDLLAANRRIVAFDNTGVGGSSGSTPSTVAEMARDAIAFLDAIGIDLADLLGFSLGSFVAQQIALTRPTLVRAWCSPRRPRRAPAACTGGRRR